MAIRINGQDHGHYGINVSITQRPKTVLVEAYQWCGHRSSAAEGPIAEVRIVRPTVAEAVAELRRRWMSLAGRTEYVGFGGQFRHEEYYSAARVEETMDALAEALEEAGLVTA